MAHSLNTSTAAQLLRERIAREGPLSFRDFMAVALYEPRVGYYARLRGFGPEGDFVTSPEVHPAFAWLLARQVAEVWQTLGQPRPLQVLEYGAGSGALASGLLRALSTSGIETAYWIEERSPSLQAVQRERLAGQHGVRWGTPDEPVNLVLANEVLDAAPVYRVTVRNGRLRELRVRLAEDGAFAWQEAEGAPAEVEQYFARLGLLPPEGAVTEVNPELEGWVQTIAARLAPRAIALVLDYGYTAADLYARPQGTLLTYHRHRMGSDPLVRVGEQDISAHVDFTTVARAAHAAGLQVLGLTTQATLLRHLGLAEVLRAAPDEANREALSSLADRAGLGNVKALFLAASLPDYQPVGLHGGQAWPGATDAPMLRLAPPPADFLEQWQEAFGGTEDDEEGTEA